MRDFMINRGFRRDYWVKGGLRTPATAKRTLLQQRLVLARPKALATRHVPEGALSPELSSALVELILDLLADHQAQTVEHLIQAMGNLGHAESDVLCALLCLVTNYTLACAQDEANVEASTQRAQKLNDEIVRRSMDSSEVLSLASPVTGGGISVPQIQLQMLAARANGHASPQQWASHIWPIYRSKGQVFTLNGAPLRSEEENLHYIGELGQAFSRLELPMLQALGCVA
jgi:Zn finger protein HypA/HybF involved in hydrogenase expression